jgi:hypothetical protein
MASGLANQWMLVVISASVVHQFGARDESTDPHHDHR